MGPVFACLPYLPDNRGSAETSTAAFAAAVPFPGVRIRIVDFPKPADGGWKYESDIRIAKDCNTLMTQIDEAYRQILSQIPAQEIQEIEPFD